MNSGALRDELSAFPLYLPDNDEAHPAQLMVLKAELQELEELQLESSAVDGEAGDKLHFTTPYVDAAYVATDVELSTRFLLMFEKWTSMGASPPMLWFAARIFFRGIRRFEHSDVVHVGLITFLLLQAKALRFARDQAASLLARNPSSPIAFQAWTATQQLETLLKMDNRHRTQKIERLARRHQETLQTVCDMWRLLSGDDVDPQLFAIASDSCVSRINETRGQYLDTLVRLPNHVDVLTLYGRFCRDVLLNIDAAEQVEVCAQELVARRAARATRGAKKKEEGNDMLTPIPTDAEVASQNSGKDFDSHVAATVRRVTFITATGLALLVVGMFVAVNVFDGMLTTRIHATFYAGELRALAVQVGVAIQEVSVLQATGDADAEPLRRSLLATRSDMLRLHNALTVGDYAPASAAHADSVRLPRFVVPTLLGEVPLSAWTLSAALMEMVHEAATNPNTTNHTVKRLGEHLPRLLAPALNESAQYYRRSLQDTTASNIFVNIGLLCAIFLFAIGSVVALSMTVVQIWDNKAAVFTALDSVDRRFVKQLLRVAKGRVERFEKFAAMSPTERMEMRPEEIDVDDLKILEAAEAKEDRRASSSGGRRSSSLGGGASTIVGPGAKTPEQPESVRHETQPSSMRSGVALALLLSLIVGLIATAISYTSTSSDNDTAAYMLNDASKLAREGIDLAQRYVVTGDAVRYRQALDGTATSAEYFSYRGRKITALFTRDARAVEVYDMVKALGEALDVAVTLTASALGHIGPAGVVNHSSRVSTWTDELLLDKFMSDPLKFRRRQPPLNGSAADFAATPSVKLAAARALVLSDAVAAAATSIEVLLESVVVDFVAANRPTHSIQVVAIAAFAIATVFAVLSLVHGSATRVATGFAACVGVLALVALVLSGVGFAATTATSTPARVTSAVTETRVRRDMDTLLSQLRLFVARDGDARWLWSLVKVADGLEREYASPSKFPTVTDARTNPFRVLLAPGSLLSSVPTVSDETLRDLDWELEWALAAMCDMAQVSLQLTHAAVSSVSDRLTPFNVSNLFGESRWDFQTMALAAESLQLEALGYDAVRYNTTTAAVSNAEGTCVARHVVSFSPSELHAAAHFSDWRADMSAPPLVQKRIAMNALFSRFMSSVIDRVANRYASAVAEATRGLVDKESRDAKTASNLAIGAIAVAAVGIVGSAALIIIALLSSIQAVGRKGSSLSDLMRRVNPLEALLCLACVIIACVSAAAVMGTNAALLQQLVEEADAATYREYLVSYSMLQFAVAEGDPSLIAVTKAEQEFVLSEIRRTMDNVYFYHESRGVGRNAAQDAKLFAEFDTAFVETAFRAPAPLSPCGGRSHFLRMRQDLQPTQTLASGLSPAYDSEWVRVLRRFMAAESEAEVKLVENEASSLAPMLLRALRASSQEYLAETVSVVSTGTTAVNVCLAFALLFIVAYAVIGLFRFASAVSREEGVGSTLLKLLPSSVVDTSPQLKMFIESGSFTTGADTSLEQVMANAVADSSLVPVIAIDHKGKILRFSSAAEKAFGYAAIDVIGTNVRVLMPQEIAEKHDGYLARYRRTKIKHVIDMTRRLRARRASGELFPVELSVAELEMGNESVYVAFARDMSTEMRLTLQSTVNNTVLDMSAAALIAADEIGTIILANPAVTALFGYEKHELLRENVKMLMPSEIASQHDYYLSRYKATGVKHIIDSSRVVPCQHKRGDTFFGEVTVREIKGTQVGEPSTYVGQITDATEATTMKQQNMVNDQIADLSPVPIIAINDAGQLLKFSRAACKLFGYTHEEVERGLNIQQLMPPGMGDHTAFVNSYRRRTGSGEESTVVGQTRILPCMKKNRSIFRSVITVREIAKSGMNPVFLAYIRDASEEEAARERRMVMEAAMQASALPCITIDYRGRILTFNEAACATFEYTREEVMGQNVKMLTPPEIAKNHDRYLSSYLKTREKHVIDKTRFVMGFKKSKKRFPVEINVRECEAEKVEDTVYVGYVRDVTAKRDTTRQFMVNEVIAELSTIPIISIDPDGRILMFSPAAERVFGYTALEVEGENIKMLMTRATAAVHDQYLSRFHQTKKKTVIDTVSFNDARRKDGTIFRVELSIRELERKGERSSFVGFVRDVTSDSLLEEQVQFAGTLREMSSVPIIQISTDGTIEYFNPATTRALQYQLSDCKGKNIKMMMSKELAVVHDQYLKDYLEGRGRGAVNSTRRIQAVVRDGTLVDAEISIGEVKSEVSDKHSFVAYMRPLRDELELDRANRVINDIANMSVVPIVAIDHLGRIVKYNKAAETVFGWTLKQALHQNVKKLMPIHIAEKHDKYLRTYQNTGVKNVVGKTLRQTAQRMDGRQFPVELSIREVKSEAAQNMFISYIRDLTEDQTVSRAQQVSRVVMEVVPSPIIVIDCKGTILRASHSCATTFGYGLDELEGQNVKLLMHQADAKHHDKRLATYMRTKIKNVVDSVRRVSGRKRDGSTLTLDLMVKELNQSGETFFVAYIHDVTDTLQLTSVVRVNENVIKSSPLPLIAMTASGVVTEFSPSAESTFGWKRSEMIGQSVTKLMPSKIGAKHSKIVERALTRKSRHTDFSAERFVEPLRRDGSTFQAKIFVQEVRREGQESLLIGYVEDMSSRVEAEFIADVAQGIIRSSPSAVVVIQPNGIVTAFNKAAEDLFEYAADEVVGRNVSILMPSEIALVHDSKLSAYAKTGVKTVLDATNPVPITGRKKSGERVLLTIAAKEAGSDADGTRHFVGFLTERDIGNEREDAMNLTKAISQANPAASIVISDRGTIRRFNRAAQELFGYTEAQALGQNIKILMPDQYAVHHDGYLDRYRREKVPHVIGKVTDNLVGLRRDGSKFPAKLLIAEHQVADEASVFIGSVVDMSASQRQAGELEMSKSAEFGCENGIILADYLGKILRVNPAAIGMFGYPELVGENLRMLMPAETAKMHDGYMRRYHLTGVNHVVDKTREVTAQHANGSNAQMKLRIRHVKGNTAEEGKFVGVIENVDRDTMAATAVLRSEAFILMVPRAILVIDSIGTVLRFNDAAQQLFEYSREEIVGKNVRMLMTAEHRHRHDGYLDAYRKTGVKKVVDRMTRVPAETRSGRVVTVELRVRELKVPRKDPLTGATQLDLVTKRVVEDAIFVGLVGAV